MLYFRFLWNVLDLPLHHLWEPEAWARFASAPAYHCQPLCCRQMQPVCQQSSEGLHN